MGYRKRFDKLEVSHPVNTSETQAFKQALLTFPVVVPSVVTNLVELCNPEARELLEVGQAQWPLPTDSLQ